MDLAGHICWPVDGTKFLYVDTHPGNHLSAVQAFDSTGRERVLNAFQHQHSYGRRHYGLVYWAGCFYPFVHELKEIQVH
jgi:hypothetical protein